MEREDRGTWQREAEVVTPRGETEKAVLEVMFADELDNKAAYATLAILAPDGGWTAGNRREEASEPSGPAP